jgi:hypothetical protein
VRLWDLDSGKELRRFDGHREAVRSVAFSADGLYAVSGSGGAGSGEKDQSVHVWLVATGKELCRLEGHRNHVWSVAFSADGWHILSGSLDHTIRLWGRRMKGDKMTR